MITLGDLQNALTDYKQFLEAVPKPTFAELLSWCEVTDARSELLILQKDLDTLSAEVCLSDRCEVWGTVAQVIDHLEKVRSILRQKPTTTAAPKLRLISFDK